MADPLDQPTFNIFGADKKSDIRVGYISTTRGYVSGINICEANRVAELNPGTTFILKNRDQIRYRNINEINDLTPEQAFDVSEKQGTCPGIELDKPNHEVVPKAEFYGGGGVGVKGNPIIGTDGSVMAVHLVSGGNGYLYNPIVDVFDPTDGGGGAVFRSVLGETAFKTEVYSAEEEFEEYFPTEITDICGGDESPEKAGRGRRYSPDGKDLGPWDPSVYINNEGDPFRREVEAYQEFLKTLTNPWWFSRKKPPLQVTSDDSVTVENRRNRLNLSSNRTTYNVYHYAWGGEHNPYIPGGLGTLDDTPYQEEVFQIYTQGGHGRGLQFTFTEVQDINSALPGGNHTFVVKADDYVDGGGVRSITLRVKPHTNYKVTSQGSHRRGWGTKKGLLETFGRDAKALYKIPTSKDAPDLKEGLTTSNKIFADLIGTNDDYDDLQISSKFGKFTASNPKKAVTHAVEIDAGYDLTYRWNDPTGGSGSGSGTNFGDLSTISPSFMNNHAISPVPMSNKPGSDFAGILFTMEWEEEFPYPGEYIFKGQCDNIATFYLNGVKEATLNPFKGPPSTIKKNLTWTEYEKNKSGKVYKIRLDLLNTPQYHDVIIQDPPQPDTPDVDVIKTVICHAGGGKGGTDNQAQLHVGKVIVGQGGDGGPGGDDDMWDHHGGKGGGAGLRSGGHAQNPMTHTQRDDIGTARQKGAPGGFGVNFSGHQVGIIQQTVWPGKYNGGNGVVMGGGGGGNADQGRGGFGGHGGVQIHWGLTGKSQQWRVPGKYSVTVPGNVGEGTGESLLPVTARFEGDNINDLHLVVSGTGTCECTLLLDTNDSWDTASLAVREMKCGSITLTRTAKRKNETLIGTGTFVGGQRYPIQIIGASSRAGSRLKFSPGISSGLFQRANLSIDGVSDTRIELDDNASTFDINASINLRVSPNPQPMSGVTIVCIGGGGSGYTDNTGDDSGGGGSGGAYAWVNQTIPSGTKLEIIVGKGGGEDNEIQGSHNGGDSLVTMVERAITPPLPPTPPTPGIGVTKVFNTADWIDKANRQLWRTNVYGGGGFANAAGVCPFDTNRELIDNPYAGSHEIIWSSVSFPVSGNYTIKVDVDDSVTLKFIGSGGETIIRKDGFAGGVGGYHSTGTSSYTRFFKKGMYKILADLEQIPGGRFGFRKEPNGDKIKQMGVSFKVTSSADFANKITIPGLFSLGKQYKGPQLNQNILKMVDVGKEYDVILTSDGRKDKKIKLRIKDGGKRLEMEEYTDDDFRDIVCTVTAGQFYSIQGNRCKFRLDTNKGINPMHLAVDIEVAYATKKEISAKSWQENPMGVAFTIKAPIPPAPIQPKPAQEGRCPNNPMWTTRFPDSEVTWYPVIHDPVRPIPAGAEKGWSKFLNRWAISPALPLPFAGTDKGGKWFSNSWKIEIPYDGYYELKGESDDFAKFFVDDKLKLDLTKNKMGRSKFFLSGGVGIGSDPKISTLRIEVKNRSTVTYKTIDKKIFSARDWKRETPVAPPLTDEGGIICHAGGGFGGTDNQSQRIVGRVKVGQGGDGGRGLDDNEYGGGHAGRGGGAGLRNGKDADGPGHDVVDAAQRAGWSVVGGYGGYGVDFRGIRVANQQEVTPPGMKFGGNGGGMGGGGGGVANWAEDPGPQAGSGADGGVQIIWGLTGKSQEWTTPGEYEVTVPGNIGDVVAETNIISATAKFEGTNINDIYLVVSGNGTIECNIKLVTDDKWHKNGVALTAMKCGDISLTRTRDKTGETLSGSGTFVAGKRYKVEIIGASARAGQPRIADTRIELLDTDGDDTNAWIALEASSEPQPMSGVTIVCIGGGGSGFQDRNGDRMGGGGSGGAYAWINKPIGPGKKLKITVGAGGKAVDAHASANGSDSYVELVDKPDPQEITKDVEDHKGKVIYNGPHLFHFQDARWGKVMNKYSVSPANPDSDITRPSPDNVGVKTMLWKNVNFPYKGQYEVVFLGDNKATLYVGDEKVLFVDENYKLNNTNGYQAVNINTPGRLDIRVELNNTYHANLPTPGINDDVFIHNPSGFVLEITKPVDVSTNTGKSWVENPIGVGGILVPPPCPKEVGGKGVVTDVIPVDPGVGFPTDRQPAGITTYPVRLTLKDVIVAEPGINYDCSKDQVVIDPPIATIKLECGAFGRIVGTQVLPPPQTPPGGPPTTPPTIAPPITADPKPIPVVEWPDIRIDSDTGLNAKLTPVFDVEVVPPDVLPADQILQVTDLAGIKQTGYYDGKPYFGAIFYKEGIKYAGWYETSGQLIQIYDTLQESIDATVTTPPSAILRQGSDVTSNDPRLDIPGTPDTLT